ncbi:MAG: hypothetical protein A2275_07405 [Bacteroidetes bacterium RIFOXYA12_FULL_35_11]|nr:MAG: hypothetical protein A2X01_06495 [Bacteroidetes bacterium GWF2_35_48]OFY73074.1 MAG: hypothetical protein A2275_07405 [Bacteroidetes bacterium RIFOXYA12_FULL_35_11]OFY94624.1 MAG: hypothetical protein A2491_08915 [Bacteroidetes bacterium RIFOXYC12_FULL_35_7]OFY97434.1 MAG: hypothetical protein A2309_04070 [Bacteroidetes bacterium RIFOXYB2_FULL_35_7]HBX53527.1 hypothetical protein [Bacteroidales bacterium]
MQKILRQHSKNGYINIIKFVFAQYILRYSAPTNIIAALLLQISCGSAAANIMRLCRCIPNLAAELR